METILLKKRVVWKMLCIFSSAVLEKGQTRHELILYDTEHSTEAYLQARRRP